MLSLIAVLEFFAGTGNIVSPHATAEAVLPGFIFLGFAMVCAGLSLGILGVQRHGVPMTLEEETNARSKNIRPSRTDRN